MSSYIKYNWIGPELIINGGFDTSSNWGFWWDGSIYNGKVVVNSVGINFGIYQTPLDLQYPGSYQIEYDVSILTSPHDNVYVSIDGVIGYGHRNTSGHVNIIVPQTIPKYGYVTIACSATYEMHFTLDNFSIKQIHNSMIVPGGNLLGPELISNGTFNNATGWTIVSSWAISDGSAGYDGAVTNRMYTSSTVTAGKRYKITFNANNLSGTARLFIADLAGTGQIFNTPYTTYYPITTGLNTWETRCNLSSNVIALWGANGYGAFNIDNLSIKEILSNKTVVI